MSESVCLSATEVNWHIIANLGFKFRSKFTAHCRRGEGSSQKQHLALCLPLLGPLVSTCTKNTTLLAASLLYHTHFRPVVYRNKKHLKNVGPIRHTSRRTPIQQVSPPAHRCPRRQRQRVTEGTAMAPWNGPNKRCLASLKHR